MHVLTLEIKNLRSIKSETFEFNIPLVDKESTKYPNVTVLLGENGVGKSTVLRAVAMSVLAPALEKGSGFVSDGYIRREPGPRKAKSSRAAPRPRARIASAVATVSLHPQDRIPVRSAKTHVSMLAELRGVGDYEELLWSVPTGKYVGRIREVQYESRSSAFFLVGYGSTRRVEQSRNVDVSARLKARRRSYERVAGLFEEHYSLIPLSYWLPEFALKNKGRHKQVITLINKLLPGGCRLIEKPARTENGIEYMFTMSGIDVPFRALSDGYRAYIGWIADMLYHLCMGAPSGKKIVDNRGVVLIDEVDLHLHPEWQRVVLPTLSTALPNIQFIVTTHSPLVVGSLQRDNIIVLEASDAGTTARRLPETVHGKSAGQILLSPYFGLDSTRAPDVAADLEKIKDAAQKGDLDAPLKYLELLAKGELA